MGQETTGSMALLGNVLLNHTFGDSFCLYSIHVRRVLCTHGMHNFIVHAPSRAHVHCTTPLVISHSLLGEVLRHPGSDGATPSPLGRRHCLPWRKDLGLLRHCPAMEHPQCPYQHADNAVCPMGRALSGSMATSVAQGTMDQHSVSPPGQFVCWGWKLRLLWDNPGTTQAATM